MNPGLSGGEAEGGVSRKLCRVLSGVDVGLSAAVAVLCWLVFHSWLKGEFWWAKLNVAGALFYGPGVYSMGLGRATVAGFALLMVVYTSLGTLFSWVARSEGYARNLMLALAWSGVWHLVAQRWFWPGLDAFGPLYFPVLATLPAHLIAALCLARYAARYRSLALSFGDAEWASALAEEPAGVVMMESAEPPEEAAAEGAGSGPEPEKRGAEEVPAPAPEGEAESRREAVGREDERSDC